MTDKFIPSTSSPDTEPHPVDVHVGQRVRLRRKALGVSQQGLAARLGVSFQQLQKYERGVNRISASKLYEISKALGVPIDYCFEGLTRGSAPLTTASDMETNTVLTEEAQLLDHFRGLKAEERKFVMNAVRRISRRKG
ncbi:Cro/Cl family transcriptional regulator [Asticcacaulis sp. AC460]|uniref:helix-turn-helix domain-containing protein n=1 Tax=Asticcacaulis sp. AC460 TaxID=1282360 RepID=UPI0003C3D0D8|nr:helix-turn-helix transcriptional regulator [Asticcacaulis sp. AC460]ESQ88134.1 Cro/Cl family transcriptional regulator [Asticcacaulis sp. AC460]